MVSSLKGREGRRQKKGGTQRTGREMRGEEEREGKKRREDEERGGEEEKEQRRREEVEERKVRELDREGRWTDRGVRQTEVRQRGELDRLES